MTEKTTSKKKNEHKHFTFFFITNIQKEKGEEQRKEDKKQVKKENRKKGKKENRK